MITLFSENNFVLQALIQSQLWKEYFLTVVCFQQEFNVLLIKSFKNNN